MCQYIYIRMFDFCNEDIVNWLITAPIHVNLNYLIVIIFSHLFSLSTEIRKITKIFDT